MFDGRYIRLFCEKTDELSEAFYYLTMLESATLFLSNLKAEDLSMDEITFQQYYSGAVRHHKPLSKSK